MNKIVIWSGGNDSTLVLWNELEEHGKVEAWTFDWQCVHKLQRDCEGRARSRFETKVQEMGWELSSKVITIAHSEIIPYGHTVMHTALFVPMVVYLAPVESIIFWGFCFGDDFWQFKTLFEWIKHYQCELMQKKINFEYPLYGKKKYEILNEIRELGLQDCVWSCESPKESLQPCGKCNCCITEKLAHYEYKLREKNNGNP